MLFVLKVMQCVREVRRSTVSGAEMEDVGGAGPADEALRVQNWLAGSYSRLKRSMESAISHPTGRVVPILWRMYMSLEVCPLVAWTCRFDQTACLVVGLPDVSSDPRC